MRHAGVDCRVPRPSSTPTRWSRCERVDGRVLVVVAARVGPARLIDNVLIEQVATHA